MLLIHGRKNPDDEMNDWGFDGPVLEGVEYLVVTYNTHYRLGFRDAEAMKRAKDLTGWEEWDDDQLLIQFHDDLVKTSGLGEDTHYYGDWEVQLNAKV